MATSQDSALLLRLTRIRHIVLVLSGKGGVGKSSVSVQLALSLLHLRPSARVGLLDVDLTGPSIPCMLGVLGKDVLQSRDGWVPVEVDVGDLRDERDGGLRCMSIAFLLKNPGDAVVWRGPKKNAMVRQFLADVRWGDLDWLIIDTSPGTSDEHISLLEHLSPLFTTPSTPIFPLPTLSSILVSTPQSVSLLDVSKELSFARKTCLPVLGLIENMSGYVCPHCGEVQNIFGSGGGERFCIKESVGWLGRVPIDVGVVRLFDQAKETKPVAVVNGRTEGVAAEVLGRTKALPNGAVDDLTVLDRYRRTSTFPIFKAIVEKVVGLVEEQDTRRGDTSVQG